MIAASSPMPTGRLLPEWRNDNGSLFDLPMVPRRDCGGSFQRNGFAERPMTQLGLRRMTGVAGNLTEPSEGVLVVVVLFLFPKTAVQACPHAERHDVIRVARQKGCKLIYSPAQVSSFVAQKDLVLHQDRV